MNYNEADLIPEEYTIDISNILRNTLRGLKKLFWILPLCICVMTSILCFYARETYYPLYTASVTFTVNLSMESNGSLYEERTRASQLSATFPYIITSSILKNIIAEELGIEELNDYISAYNIEETNLFTIMVTSYEPQRAYDILQSVIKNYPLIADTVVGRTYLNMIEETGIPKEPSNPVDYLKYIKYGVATGLALGMIIIIAYAFARKTIHKPDDLKEITNIKFLGMLPHIPTKSKRKKLADIRERASNDDRMASEYLDDLYKIRTRVNKIINNNGMKTILITSSIPGEGKSTFAYNFALAMAEQDKKVILVDCDFRRPSMINLLPEKSGNVYLNDVLEEKAELSDAIKYYDDLKLWVLICSKPISNASEIIGAQSMSNILEELRENYDYIILDSAPSAIISDTLELAKSADGIIFVIRQDYSKVRHIQVGLEHIVESSKAEVIGCVLNNVKNMIMGYGYGYSYGYRYYGGSYGYSRKYKGRYRSKYKKESGELASEHTE